MRYDRSSRQGRAVRRRRCGRIQPELRGEAGQSGGRHLQAAGPGHAPDPVQLEDPPGQRRAKPAGQVASALAPVETAADQRAPVPPQEGSVDAEGRKGPLPFRGQAEVAGIQDEETARDQPIGKADPSAPAR